MRPEPLRGRVTRLAPPAALRRSAATCEGVASYVKARAALQVRL